MFIDQAEITVRGGSGGNGCMSFRREKFLPKGGPDGGDGGNGGSVYCRVDEQMSTLMDFRGRQVWQAGNGGPGQGANRHGKNGQDAIVPVPPGTLIIDAERGIVLKDLTAKGESVCVARGGRGGRGNTYFKSSTNQAPREFETGEPGRERKLRLELKLLADVALVGKPNAGKSTLLSRVSAARPKIASYPFTTLIPQLGIVDLPDYRRFVMADIPGLIAGAHDGAGLGDTFLRHIERTRVLVHMVDAAPLEGDPIEDYHVIRQELQEYSPALAAKPEIIVANKLDLTDAEAGVELLEEALGRKVLAISAATGRGLDELKETIWKALNHDSQR